MLALKRSANINLGEDLKQLQSYIEVTQKGGVVNFLKFIKLIIDAYSKKRAARLAISINKRLSKILSEIKTSVVNEEAVKDSRFLLGRIKEMKVSCEPLTLNSPKLDEQITRNIQLAYKIEKEVRQSFYFNHKGEMSDLAKAATSISSQNIGFAFACSLIKGMWLTMIFHFLTVHF